MTTHELAVFGRLPDNQPLHGTGAEAVGGRGQISVQVAPPGKTSTSAFGFARRWIGDHGQVFGPVIEGKVCRLRPPRVQDAQTMIGWFEDQAVTARIRIQYPPSLEDEEAWLRRMASIANDVLWAIEREGTVIGSSGIHGIDWTHQRATTGTVIGDRRYWGMGVGRESMQLRTDYAFRQLPLQKLCSSYLDGNEASRRAQLAVGYREVGRRRRHHWLNERWHDEVLTEILREDWERSRRPPTG